MALQSIPEPRKVARDLFALGIPRDTLWQMLALLLVIGAAIGVGSSMLFPVAPELEGSILGRPMLVAGLEAGVAVMTVFLIYHIGRGAGGTGTFDQSLVTVIWLNFVLLIVQFGVFILSLFAAPIAALLWMAGGVAGFYILSHFIAEMHGFTSAGKVFAAILLISFVAVAVLSVILALIGFGTGTVEELGNV
nr:Yip1 family protein [Maritimibacter dapengensis]